MIPLWMLRHFKTPMPRRRRPIGKHITPIERFLRLRQPFGLPIRVIKFRALRKAR